MSDATILCMFSGGIDSAGVLHKLITDDAYRHYNLIVHHIILQNRENRAAAEINAVNSILKFYKKHHADRPFLYTENVFNTEGFAPLKANRFPYDMDVCAFTAANICVIRKDIKHVAMGRTKTDVTTATGNNSQRRMMRAQNVFKALYSLETEPAPEYIFPVIDMTKKEIWDYLPKDIRAATWYCRRPIYQEDGSATACKKCSTCQTASDFVTDG